MISASTPRRPALRKQLCAAALCGCLAYNAVQAALAEGSRTADIASGDEKTLSTSEMGSAIISQMEALSA